MEPTLVDILAQLRREGYTEDFNLQQHCLTCRNGATQVEHDAFHVDKFFRLEGNSDPSDEVVIYAISAPEHGLKGVLINAYGMYHEPLTDEMERALRIDPS